MELQTISKPNKIPFKCPVCNGFGTLKYGTVQCQGCGGKGWVIVNQEDGQMEDQNGQSRMD